MYFLMSIHVLYYLAAEERAAFIAPHSVHAVLSLSVLCVSSLPCQGFVCSM